jgi:CheY-like chemotaxis protein
MASSVKPSSNSAYLDQPLRSLAEALRGRSRPEAPLTVLIVEDQLVVALDMAEAVTELGCRAIGPARSAEAAVAMARRERPDLILMDVTLTTELTGVDAAAVILQELGLPIVFVTADAARFLMSSESRAFRVGLVEKPFTPRQLHLAILDLLAERPETAERLCGAAAELVSAYSAS